MISTILHPASMSLSLSTWLVSADYHSYVDAQSIVISGIDILILLDVISP
jgi:hypothetical protein